MDVNEVIELGKIAAETNFELMIFDWKWMLVGVMLLCLTVWFASDWNSVFFGLWIILSMFYLSIYPDFKADERIEEWKETIAHPYIEQLPKEQKEIVYLKIDPELSHDTKGGLFYTYSTPVQLTPLTISYKDNGVPTITRWTETHMELTNDEKPFIEFQKLSQNLGNGVNKGLYNIKVNLPESYEFTDIK